MDKPENIGWKNTYVLVLTVIALSFTYAFIRYNIVRNVPFDNFPLYIANKSIAVSTTILIGMSFLLGPLARFWPSIFAPYLYLRKHLGIIGFALASFHAIVSLVLLSPAYYSKLFTAGGKFNLMGESSLLFGILSFLIFFAIFITSLPAIEAQMKSDQWKIVQRLGYLAYFFVLMHVAIMGFQGWFNADSWKFGLISISLISAMFIIFVLIMRLLVIAFPSKK